MHFPRAPSTDARLPAQEDLAAASVLQAASPRGISEAPEAAPRDGRETMDNNGRKKLEKLLGAVKPYALGVLGGRALAALARR